MHVLLKIIVPPEAVWNDESIDINEVPDSRLEKAADEAITIARWYVEENISIHGDGSNGFADWHKDGAGRWTDSLLKDYTNVYAGLAVEEQEIVLIGDDAIKQLEIGWESTKDDLGERQRQIRADLEESELMETKEGMKELTKRGININPNDARRGRDVDEVHEIIEENA